LERTSRLLTAKERDSVQQYHRYAVAIGAGAASALLFAVSATTNPLAMALAYLAPLPIMIATLGWGLIAGAVAAGVSAAALAVIGDPTTALAFSASIAAPGWLLAAFTAAPLPDWLRERFPNAAERVSVGGIVTAATVIAMIGALAALATLIVIYHGYDTAATKVAKALADAIAAEAAGLGENGVQAKVFAEALVHWGPMAIAASTLLMLCVNLYAAARSTQVSQSLGRPWPDLPTSLSLPRPLGFILILCAAGTAFLPLPASQFASIGVGGLGGAFVLQGLAVAHALSRGLKLRPVMLIALYLCCIFRAIYILPALAALGVIDAFIRLRARAAPLPAPKAKTQKRS
jgi:hypothetical protein